MRSARTRRPIAIDAFAGGGGLSLGLEQAGFDVAASVDYDPVHVATHAYNFPHTDVLCASVADLSADALLAAAGRGATAHGRTDWDGDVDLIAGGPPCQGFSMIGKRQLGDDRNELIFHFWRLVDQIRPRYFVMENVPGMASGAHGALLDELADRFRGSGYRLAPSPTILNAAWYGVPQGRKRLVLVGARDDQEPFRYPDPVSRPAIAPAGWGNPGLPAGPTVADAIADLPDLDGFEDLLAGDEVRLDPALADLMRQAQSGYVLRLNGTERDPADRSYPRAWDPTVLTSSARTVHTALSVSRFAATVPGRTEPVSRFLRLDPDGLCNTLRAGTGAERGAHTSPRPIHPSMPRVISVREAARLHSFPDWFRLHGTKWHGFRQIGNAVPPLLGRAVGQAVADALGVRPARPRRTVESGDPRFLTMTMTEAARAFGADRSSMPGQRTRTPALSA